MLGYLADISSMCRLASWQAETTGALGMLSVQEICLILRNAAANPSLPPAKPLQASYIFPSPPVTCVSAVLLISALLLQLLGELPVMRLSRLT